MKKVNYEVFRTRLKDLISSRGMTPREFSIKAGISNATVSRYLSEQRTPKIEYVWIIADYFGVSMDWLLGVTDENTNVYSQEIINLMNAYQLADEDDKAVIQLILKKYT